MKNILLSLFLAIIFIGPLARPAQALGPLIDSSVLSDTDCVGPACQYSLNTFMKLGINVANIILGVVGAVALVVFVYGGIRMMASGGNAEAVSTGKKSIVGAVIGLLLVFGSYSLISFTVNTVLKADSDYNFNGNINAEVPTAQNTNACSKNNGSCVKRGECIKIKGFVVPDANNKCKADTEDCCDPPVASTGNSCASVGRGYDCVAEPAGGTSCLDANPPRPCYSCVLNVSTCSGTCCGWFDVPPR